MLADDKLTTKVRGLRPASPSAIEALLIDILAAGVSSSVIVSTAVLNAPSTAPTVGPLSVNTIVRLPV